MKYIKITLLLLLTTALFAGCSDYFDVKPKTEIRSEDLFQSESGFWRALTGVYLNMANREAYGGYLSWEGIEFMAWQHQTDNGNSSWYSLQRGDYTSTGSLNFIDKTWGRLYNIIAEANYLLFALDEYGSFLAPAVYENIKGQCLGIRAYCHFDLMRLFAQGNLAADPSSLTKPCIPYVTAYDKEITPQQSYAWTLDRAMEDVTEAIGLLDADEYPEAQRVKKIYSNMNIDAIKLLAARIELWRGNTAAALEYANGFIDDKSWRVDAMIPTPLLVDELRFMITVYNLFSWTENQWLPTASNRLVSVRQNSVEENLFMMGQTNYGVENGDMRYLNWYEVNNDGNPDDYGTLSVKVRYGFNSSSNYIALIRISEAWLIAAECELAKTTPESKARAIELINDLRNRRGNSASTFITDEDIPDEELREIIVLEQLREVSQEGQAFFLYKRLNIANMVNSGNPMSAAEYVLPYPQTEQQAGHNQ